LRAAAGQSILPSIEKKTDWTVLSRRRGDCVKLRLFRFA
jgi:hypothetical protein